MSFNFMNYNFDNQQPRPHFKLQGQRFPQQHTRNFYFHPFSPQDTSTTATAETTVTAIPIGTPTPTPTPSFTTSPPPPQLPAAQVPQGSQGTASGSPRTSGSPAGFQVGLTQGRGMTEDAPSTQLFISNIPSKVREEEIVALFKPFPGFISGRLRRTRMNNYIAFVEFDTVEHSGKARDTLNGYNFDTKMVPSNNTQYTRQQLKQFGITIDFSRVQQPQNQQQQQQQQQQLHPIMQHKIPFGVSADDLENPYVMHPEHIEMESSSTLYVEGLPQDCTKREAAHIFRRFRGFKDLRIIPKEDRFTRNTFLLCFVDFESREDAEQALSCIQDYRMDLEHPEERGLTVFFAKTNKKTK